MDQIDTMVRTFADISPWQGEVPDGCFPNFLGVMTEQLFVEDYAPSNHLLSVNGAANLTPAPTFDDGEVFFEQAAIHKAVMEARDKFVMFELGGGYAARTVDAHAALQQHNPMPNKFVVVEAEPTHFEWALRHMQTNGMDPEDHWMINALVGTDNEPKIFLLGEGFYGNSIVSQNDIEQMITNLRGDLTPADVLRRLMLTARCGVQQPYNMEDGTRHFDFGFVSSVPLKDILQPFDYVDLMDVDIQGAERFVLPGSMAAINKKVRRIHLATHGDDLHKDMWDLFFEHGWMCETDFAPDSHHQSPLGSFKNNDGILDLLNLSLA
ncbi:MAG: hypothetical protein HN478_14030 [Rhodospirillaceae bacterium]|jgi:hypothetical protein|nr:hypothetical protein [Rhodospirillaceae bacterium]MBT5193199.1 hypothetical protein [Rhodospirillaceae bacterium]MBT5897323.1 hypothetical protein [Rhodospirillaceae bacterium]MBT6982760.1 hypothetical protein [Rhodospirillaceae bacterium]